MTTARKALLAALAVFCAVLVAVAAVFSWNYYDANSYSRQLSLGKKYYAAGEYDKAIARFQRAVQLEPEWEEGYLGLIRSYTITGDTVMAENVMKIGSQRTGSNALRFLVDKVGSGSVIHDTVDSIIPEVDREFLRLLVETTFNEYHLRKEQLPTTATGDGGCQVRIEDPPALLIFSAEAVDQILGKPNSDSRPVSASLEDITAVFGGAKTVTIEILEQLGARDIAVAADKEYGNVVSFSLENCEFTVQCDTEGTVTQGAWNRILFPEQAEEKEQSEEDETSNCTVNGRVVNAVTGGGVSGAVLTFRPVGADAEGIFEAMTDSNGNYEVSLPQGEYTAEVACEGYTPESFELSVPDEVQITADPFTISPVLAEGQIRIVLEWGSSPRDLDSYLEGSLDNGDSVYTYYGSPRSSSGGDLAAELDVDDRDGYGPETTTIYDLNGYFVFHVEDFTQSGRISESGATVKIYTPDQSAPIIVDICSGLENTWSVCEIDHGQVTVLNHS